MSDEKSTTVATEEAKTDCAPLGLLGCGVCGGKMVMIRSRWPGSEDRRVCPTCLAERMDDIRELTSADYAMACEAHPNSLITATHEP